MSLMLLENTGANGTAPPQLRDPALRWRLLRRKGGVHGVGSTALPRADVVGSSVAAVDLGASTRALAADNVSTQAATLEHLGLQTYATTNFCANAPTLGSSFAVLGVWSNGSGNCILSGSAGRAVWNSEAHASTAVLLGAQGSGGVTISVGTLTAGLCVTIEESTPETTKSILIAEHNVNEYAAGPSFVIGGPLPTGMRLELLNDGSGEIIFVPSESEASVSVAHDLPPIQTGRAIPDKFDDALGEVRDTLSEEDLVAAERAIADARLTVASLHFPSTPLIWVNDEGVAAVKWEAWPSGILLVFTGDGTFTASVRDGDRKRYINGAREYAVSGGIPPNLSEAIFALR